MKIFCEKINREIAYEEYTDGVKIIPHSTLEDILRRNSARFVIDVKPVTVSPGMCLVECRATDRETGETVLKVGESNPENLESEISRKYPGTIAYQRAIDRAVVAILGLGGKFYSDQEILRRAERVLDENSGYVKKPCKVSVDDIIDEVLEEASGEKEPVEEPLDDSFLGPSSVPEEGGTGRENEAGDDTAAEGTDHTGDSTEALAGIEGRSADPGTDWTEEFSDPEDGEAPVPEIETSAAGEPADSTLDGTGLEISGGETWEIEVPDEKGKAENLDEYGKEEPLYGEPDDLDDIEAFFLDEEDMEDDSFTSIEPPKEKSKTGRTAPVLAAVSRPKDEVGDGEEEFPAAREDPIAETGSVESIETAEPDDPGDGFEEMPAHVLTDMPEENDDTVPGKETGGEPAENFMEMPGSDIEEGGNPRTGRRMTEDEAFEAFLDEEILIGSFIGKKVREVVGDHRLTSFLNLIDRNGKKPFLKFTDEERMRQVNSFQRFRDRLRAMSESDDYEVTKRSPHAVKEGAVI